MAPQGSGFTPPPPRGYAPARPSRQSGYAVAALVCGLAPLFGGCFPIGFVGIYLGAKARRLAREQPDVYEGEGMALAGMILGGVLGFGWLIFWGLYLLIIVGAFAGVLASTP